MPFNLSGTLAIFHALVSPRILVPSVVVKDIRQLDFLELRRAGYRGAVFDKDNCLTIPHKDQLVPELKDAWKECQETFGDHNVLIVSNSAGTYLDPAQVQAESVSYHLSVPVLRHQTFKPSYSCISAVRAYFSSLPKPIRDNELIVVGDRLFTDVVLANRMSRRVQRVSSATSAIEGAPAKEESKPPSSSRTGPLSVWTSGVWEKEGMFMRTIEKGVLTAIRRYITADNGVHTIAETERFVKKSLPVEAVLTKETLARRLWSRILSRSR